MKCLHLFNGIGGFALAAHWMGWENVAHCEIDDFCNKVMNYHFPNSVQHGDIRTTDFSIYRGRIDVLTGGFPCQPWSVAGDQLGDQDERHLFPENLRAIREIKPRWAVSENVRGITTKKFGSAYYEIQTSLEAEGYDVLPLLIPASAVGAEHERYRLWIIAHPNGIRCERQQQQFGKKIQSLEKSAQALVAHQIKNRFDNVLPEPWVVSRNDGIPAGLDTEAISESQWKRASISGFGNAIVPQVAYEIFKAIEAYEN